MKFTDKQKAWLIENDLWFQDADSDKELEALRAKALYDADMASSLENRRELAKAADAGSPSYRLKAIAVTADKDKYSDKDGVKKFIEDYFSKKDRGVRDRWEDKIEEAYGEGAWDNVKKILRNAKLDMMNAEIAKNRADIIEGNAEGQGAYDKFASIVGGILMPRTKQKALEGKAIKGKDIALDAAESVAMALPFGATSLGGKVATAAAIPFASEFLDDIAYNTERPNDIAERANFNPVDVIVGTLVNLVAPEAMNRALRKAGNKFFRGGEGASSDVMDVVKDLKANDRWSLPKNWKQEANELRRIEADKMESDVLSDLKKEAGFLANDAEERAAIDRLAATHDLIEGAEEKGNKKLLDGKLEQLDQNLGGDQELLKSYKAAEDYYNMSKGLGENPDFRSILESEMSDYYGRTNDIVRAAAEDMGQLTIDQRKKLLKADDLRNLYEATEVLADKKTKDIKKGGTVTRVRKYPDNFTPSEKIAAGMEDNIDNILAVRNSGADFGDYMSLAHPKKTHAASYAKDVLNTLAANKAGNQSNAERAVTPIESFIGMPGSISKPVRKLQTEQRENAKKAQAKAVLNAMANSAQNDEDRKWLGIIAENPGIVRGEGAKALDPEFRKWMLVRGSDILRGTELYRPTFEVE